MNGVRVIELPLDLIDDTDRLRPVDPAYALLLAESIEQQGLRTPVHVTEADPDGRHRLIAGAHRLEAIRLLARKTIPALIVGVDELQARLLEIDENLIRRELTALERATFLAERKAVHEALTGRHHGGDRKSQQFQAQNQKDKLSGISRRFTEEIAERCGLSPRDITRAIARYAGLADDVRARLHGTWIADNGVALDALRRLRAEQQRAVLAALATDKGVGRDLRGAIARVTGRELPSPPDEFDRFVNLWRRMDGGTRERVRKFVNREPRQEGEP
jgi:ParB family chromosome partitioning protein